MYEDTIDWDRYWREADEADREDASPSARYVLDPVREFLEERGRPESFADVGCGAGALAFEVADVERALRELYGAVAPGGVLTVGYHNRLARAQFRKAASAPEEHLTDSPWDPDRFEDRFRLLLSGENLLSYERIHDALGTWPRSLYAVGNADRHRGWRHNPFVYVPK